MTNSSSDSWNIIYWILSTHFMQPNNVPIDVINHAIFILIF